MRLMSNDLDGWFDEEKVEYECRMCDNVAKYRWSCGELDSSNKCKYICDDCLDMDTCPECKIEKL